jgi:DNA-binding CsgD family transcriptional regulator
MLQVDAQTLHNAYWNEGETLVTLGQRYGKAPGTIHHWFQKYQIPTRSVTESRKLTARAVTPTEAQQMVELYAQGLSSDEVGAKFGRAGRLVRTHLTQAGVMRPKAVAVRRAANEGKIRATTLNARFFKTLTPASAWVLGLLFGDGHVQIIEGHSYGIHLAGSKQVLEAVAQHLGHNREPKQMKQKGKLLNCWKLAWYSKTMIEDLAKFGLAGGNKARTMRWPEGITEEMLPHFVRGLWDSDGGWTRKGEHLDARYASASDGFTQDFKEVLEVKGWLPRLSHYQTPLNGKLFSCNQLRLRAEDSRELAKWVYEGTTIELRCLRKFRIALGTEDFVTESPTGA